MALFNEDRQTNINSRYPPVYYVRQMMDSDVDEVLDIWGQNKLYEGTETIKSFLKVDPDGFFVAVDDDDGQILGMCAGVFVNPETAFIGLYGVRPKYHHLGVGMTIWRRMMDHIGDKNAGLYAVPEHLTMYRDKAGFQNEDSRRLLIYESDTLTTEDLVKDIRGIEISPIDEDIMPQVMEYDEKVHGYSRSSLLPHTFQERDTISVYAWDVIDCKVVGFGCFRTNNIRRAMAGPLYADNDAVAELIVNEIIKRFPLAIENGLLYMTLDSNPGGIRIAEKLGLEKHEEVQRLFTKRVYTEADWRRIYCIHSPNFSLF